MCRLAMQINEWQIFIIINTAQILRHWAFQCCNHTLWPHDGKWWWWCIGHILSSTVQRTPMCMFCVAVYQSFSAWSNYDFCDVGKAITKSSTTTTIKYKRFLFIHCQSLKWNRIRWMLNATNKKFFFSVQIEAFSLNMQQLLFLLWCVSFFFFFSFLLNSEMK